MYIQVDIVKWHTYGMTPLWIRLWQGPPKIWDAFRDLERENPPRLYSDPEYRVPAESSFTPKERRGRVI
jgi:hypothetical protein